MANGVYDVIKPPIVSRALLFAGGSRTASPTPQVEKGEPSGRPIQEMSTPKTATPETSRTASPVPDLMVEVSDTDSGQTEESSTDEQAPPQPTKLKVKVPSHNLRKHGLTTKAKKTKDGATPAKRRKEQEPEEAESTVQAIPLQEALQSSRFSLYKKDTDEVKTLRVELLDLPKGTEVTQEMLDSSSTFKLRQAADEPGYPESIGEHWIDYLNQQGHLAKCRPKDFQCKEGWLPLYTWADITRLITGLSCLLNTYADSPLIAVVQPDTPFLPDREYVIQQLHKEECLARVSIHYEDNQRKQVAFCPYCGVMNENAPTALSHTRKHLGITYLCGGCYWKIYKSPQPLASHMKTCCPCLVGCAEKTTSSHQKGR